MKTTNLRLLISNFLILLLIVVSSSCGQKSNEESTKSNSKEFDQAETEVIDQIETLAYDIPSPSEIPFMLEATGAEFNEAFINDISKIDSYEITNDIAAMNLGVYSSDMGYLISYNKVQEALNYLSSTKNLADHLGVSASVNVELLKRFENNLANKDSLVSILDEAIDETDHFLQDDNRNRIAALLIAGSFIEGLYISTELVKTYPKDLLPDDVRNVVLTPIIRVVLNQQKSLEDLIGLMETIDQANPVGDIKENLIALKGLYSSLNIDDQIEKSRPDMVINDATLVEITEKVAAIRSSITE
ncbi:MAG: hypothetical protein OEX22_05535 [Cyclobacteriaceae bacterium]|nr:hypothetical protein [Cyclobacteriaceae bacterium]